MRVSRILFIATVMLLATFAMGDGGFALADACTAQIGYSTPSTYYGSGAQMVVPVSATCAFTTNQLYVIGNAYDQSSNLNLGPVSAVLNPTDGGNNFSGQLLLNLPANAQGHTVEITISIYNNVPSGPVLATAMQTVQIPGSSYYYYYPNYPYTYYPNNCYPGNCYYYYYSTPSYPSYTPPDHHHCYRDDCHRSWPHNHDDPHTPHHNDPPHHDDQHPPH